MQQQLSRRVLPNPGRDAAGLGSVVTDHVLEVAVSRAAAAQADLARRVRMVAMQVHVALEAASEALLHPHRIGVAEVGRLRDAKLKAEPHDEVGRREVKKGVRELGLQIFFLFVDDLVLAFTPKIAPCWGSSSLIHHRHRLTPTQQPMLQSPRFRGKPGQGLVGSLLATYPVRPA